MLVGMPGPARPTDVTAADGTRLRAWDNGGTGTPVVLSNGLGASPAAWPFLESAPDLHAVTWHHRGLGGSDRPADESRIRVSDHADDLEAVMDAAGMSRALVIGWSVGVVVALEVARRSPSRVAGLLMLGGASGSFRVLPEVVPAPEAVHRGAARASAWLLRVVGPALSGLASVPGLAPRDWQALGPAWGTLGQVAGEFARHDWTWFSRLVLAAFEHDVVDVGTIRAPATVVAGEFDTLAPVADMVALAEALPDARLVRLPGSHFLPLQFPETLDAELRALRARA
jgi:pimeloyl-ACP methyl ester carboxylesterase